jgi:demethylmenaquinone methyltransferase/2-methoxy-6-polyprenyl-1,4-benzoquinol methylase
MMILYTNGFVLFGSSSIKKNGHVQAVSARQDAVLPPHPAISNAYEGLGEKRQFVDTLFDATARDYDRVERWLSLGTGHRYRTQAMMRAGLRAGMRAIDVGIGTGLVATGVKSIVGPTGSVVGIDPSSEMRRHAHEHYGIEVIAGIAEAIPFDDESFDFLSMGYALRHISDLHLAFQEFYRVLQPRSGRLCILELTRPRTRLGRAAIKTYLAGCVRTMRVFCRLGPRTLELWRYYWKTIEACIPPEQVMGSLIDAGFVDVQRHVVGGVFSEYTATRGESLPSHDGEVESISS